MAENEHDFNGGRYVSSTSELRVLFYMTFVPESPCNQLANSKIIIISEKYSHQGTFLMTA